jgi:hypothetical protein
MPFKEYGKLVFNNSPGQIHSQHQGVQGEDSVLTQLHDVLSKASLIKAIKNNSVLGTCLVKLIFALGLGTAELSAKAGQ